MLLHTAPSPSNRNRLKIYAVVLVVATLAVLGFRSPVDTAPQFTEYDVPTPKSRLSAISLSRDGNLWFTESTGGKVGRINGRGEIAEFDVPTKMPQVECICGIQDGPQGKLWFLETLGKLGSVSASGAIHEYPTGKGGIADLAVDSTGNVWFVAWERSAIGRMKPSGTVRDFAMPHEGAPPDSIAARDDNIWFTENSNATSFNRPESNASALQYELTGGGGAWLGHITSQGKITEYPVHPAPSKAPLDLTKSTIGGIAIATDGSIWFSEPRFNRIARRATSGTVTEYAFPTPKSGVSTVTAGRNGDAWFTEPSSNKFGRVSAQGALTEYKVPTPKSYPNGIALDLDGNVWVTETGSNKILKATLPH